MRTEMFTGGIFDTNGYYLPDHRILIDAPQGVADWLESGGRAVDWMLLTHGHIDHVQDAAEVVRRHGAKVGYHRDGIAMLTEPGYFKQFGFGWEIEPVTADVLVEEADAVELGGVRWKVLLVPGHCPGSLCFYDGAPGVLFGGDVLFAGGVGRWDLPGGDYGLLMAGLKSKVLRLPDATKVYPGHGPATTVGIEKATNPYCGA